MMLILDLIADFLSLFVDIQFYRDRKKRRQFEKENNLPKKIMINPNTKAMIYLISIVLILAIVFQLYQHYYSNKKDTLKSILLIEELLIENKKADGFYPKKVEDIIRNNPFRQHIHIDAWGNTYHYEISDDGNKFILISKGRDGILNTKDDITSSMK